MAIRSIKKARSALMQLTAGETGGTKPRVEEQPRNALNAIKAMRKKTKKIR